MPVDDKVAAILRAICPDLPMPLTMHAALGGQDGVYRAGEFAVQRLAKGSESLAGIGQNPPGGGEVGGLPDWTGMAEWVLVGRHLSL